MSPAQSVAGAIADGASTLGVDLAPPAAERLAAYVAELLRWNAKLNLVGPCSPQEAVDRHVHDALAILRLVDQDEVKKRVDGWYDVGSGAGLPGLVLAVARPGLQVRLVEPMTKRVSFLRHALALVGRPDVEVVQARLEAMAPPGPRWGAMSRAVLAPRAWLALAGPWVGPQGLVLITTAHPPDALTEASLAADSVQLPVSGAPRVNLVLPGFAPAGSRPGAERPLESA